MLNESLLNDSLLSQTLNTVIKLENGENEVLTPNITVKNSPNEKINVKTEIKVETEHVDLNVTANKENVINHNNNSNNKLTNGSQISVRKLEDLCEFSPNAVKIEHLENTENIKVENTNSSQTSSNVNTDLYEWYSGNIKISQETPISCKIENFDFSDDGTSNKQKRRRLHTDTENYDILSDVIKNELSNTELYDIEVTDMLHDIDSLMDFEESKTFPNFFCSTANDSIEIDNNIEISQLLEVDPLAITDCDEDNTIVEDQINENKRTKREKVVSKPKKLSGNIKNKTKGTKITIEKTADVDYDHIKEILGTLDIDLDIKKEEEVRKKVIEEEERKEVIEEEVRKEVIEEKVRKEAIEEVRKEVIEEEVRKKVIKEEVRKKVIKREVRKKVIKKEVRKEVIEEVKEEVKEKEEEISKDALKKLYNLKVNIIHKVPPQHDIEGVLGTKPLTKTQRKLFLNYGPLKDGVFTPNEDKIIIENWKTFCEVHDWNPKYVQPFLCMTINGQFYIKSLEQRKKFAQFLANGIPWRSLYSVYHRFKNLHRKYEKSFHRYTPAEDQTILSYMKKGRKKKKHTKYADLSKILGRTSHSIWMRYQLLQKMQKDGKKESMYDVTWTLSLIGTFIKNLMNITLCNNVKDLKDAIIPKPVWLKLEEKLGIGYNLLKLFWWNQLHAQLFSTEPIYLNDIKIKLIEYVYGKGISNTREIVWQDVAKYFDGITSIFLCKVFYYLVHKAAVKISTTDFPAIIEYLYNREIRYIKNEVIDRFLPRLSYDNEKVDFVDEGNEIQ